MLPTLATCLKKTGIFVVSVTARNSKGSDSASTKIWVQGKFVFLSSVVCITLIVLPTVNRVIG